MAISEYICSNPQLGIAEHACDPRIEGWKQAGSDNLLATHPSLRVSRTIPNILLWFPYARIWAQTLIHSYVCIIHISHHTFTNTNQNINKIQYYYCKLTMTLNTDFSFQMEEKIHQPSVQKTEQYARWSGELTKRWPFPCGKDMFLSKFPIDIQFIHSCMHLQAII